MIRALCLTSRGADGSGASGPRRQRLACHLFFARICHMILACALPHGFLAHCILACALANCILPRICHKLPLVCHIWPRMCHIAFRSAYDSSAPRGAVVTFHSGVHGRRREHVRAGLSRTHHSTGFPVNPHKWTGVSHVCCGNARVTADRANKTNWTHVPIFRAVPDLARGGCRPSAVCFQISFAPDDSDVDNLIDNVSPRQFLPEVVPN